MTASECGDLSGMSTPNSIDVTATSASPSMMKPQCASCSADTTSPNDQIRLWHRQRCPICDTHLLRQRRRRRREDISLLSPRNFQNLQFLFAALVMISLSLAGRTVAFMSPGARQKRNMRCADLKAEDDAIIHLEKERERSLPTSTFSRVKRLKTESFSRLMSSSFGSNSDLDESAGTADSAQRSLDENSKVKDIKDFNQFNVVNDLVRATRDKSVSSLDRLSKAHHSMMAKTSNMRRQRFVTGKYPLYVSVKQNPTQKWLGLAESQIYLNGTSIDKSLASCDIYNWLDDEERRELHGDYEFLSLELLAEIHVKKPGYVNILPGGGAGMSLTTQPEGGDGVFGRWKSWKSRDDDLASSDNVGDENLQHVAAGANANAEGERLWMTGFSLTNNRGELHTLDVESGVMSNVNDRTAKAIKWPNEVTSIPKQIHSTLTHDDANRVTNEQFEDALLVTDGFLVPGKDKGGLYIVRNPGNDVSEWRVCLTGITNLQDVTINAGQSDWFYHRAIWMDLTGDGRQSILAARAKLPLLQSNNGAQEDGGMIGKGQGELVWLERPMPHTFDVNTGTPLDMDGTVFDPFSPRNTPWKLRVLDEGPDVMFSVADLDPSDDTIEIIASQFFGKKLSLHSLKIGPEPKIVFRRTIDDRCGSAFSSLLADLDGLSTQSQSEHQPVVVDSGSTVVTLKEGDAFSHLLVTSHECSFAEGSGEVNAKSSQHNAIPDDAAGDLGTSTTTSANTEYSSDQSKIDGGSLFGYRIPTGKDAWKTQPWTRSIIATGFKVQGQLNNMINPGAPGFCYTFFPTREGGGGAGGKWNRPLIGISGDCAESAYLLRPIENNGGTLDSMDESTNYALMCEIKCKSTVGSLAIGYDDLYSQEQQSGYAKIYVPCYEQDKVLVFAMGSGEDDCGQGDGW